LTKVPKYYIGKTVSSTNGVKETGYAHVEDGK
jgi:hypothetical protein